MKKVRLVADARRAFFKEVGYDVQQRTGMGSRFRKAAKAAVTRAGERPTSGKPGIRGTRRLLIKGFPFAVVYLTSESEVMVCGVAQLSRTPDYWTACRPSDG